MEKFNYVLIIDDDPICNYMTKHFLEKTGICKKVLITTNGKEALRFLEKNKDNPPGMILLDLEMPVMNGFEFLENINPNILRSKKTNIILQSSNTESLEILKEKYTIEVIYKPLTFEKFFLATKGVITREQCYRL